MRSATLCAFAVLAFSACTTFIQAEDAKPAVTGEWSGRWESTAHKGHGGGLKCTAAEGDKGTWKATFTAEFGRVKDYKIELTGKLDGKKVAFGGEVNIGNEAGEGVFKWTGSADEKEFTGEYEGGGDKGTFKMTRPEKKQDK
jgi:hypothetical protein